MAHSSFGIGSFDITILGAGPVGCALALALQASGLTVALAGRKPAAGEPRAVRPIALSYNSRLILERLGAWNALAATPIERIHVSQAGGFGRTQITKEDLKLSALGYVVPYDEIAPRLAARIDAGAIRWIGDEDDEEPRGARLTVHAEGSPAEGEGGASEKDYGHDAIVGVVTSETPARGTAYERFTDAGPLALLPLGEDYALVWSRARADAMALVQAEEAHFLAVLQSAFGRRAGRLQTVRGRAHMPLVLRKRRARFGPGEVFIGNAAQTLHPVAGQGLNLGLRDVWDLAALVRRTPREALGSSALLERFARMRRRDAQATMHATDLLATLFLRRDPLGVALRSAALVAFDLLPPARRLLARRMIYGASAWP